MCDGLADSLKKDSNKTGYKHVYKHSKECATHPFEARVHDITTGKEVSLGSFYTPYAAAVTAALSKTKGLQDERDAALLSGSLKAEEAKKRAKEEGLSLATSTRTGTGFENVNLQDDGKSTKRPFRISSRMYGTMPSNLPREYVSAEHAALEIARHVRNLGRQAVAGRVATSADSNAVVIDLT